MKKTASILLVSFTAIFFQGCASPGTVPHGSRLEVRRASLSEIPSGKGKKVGTAHETWCITDGAAFDRLGSMNQLLKMAQNKGASYVDHAKFTAAESSQIFKGKICWTLEGDLMK
jgi:hypothetical protein